MKLDEFINKHIKTKVDFDGAFGAQCVDLFRQYCKDVLNIPHTGAVEGAKDLILRYNSLPLEIKYFLLTSYGVCGDIVVYNSTKINPYGHVAIYISDMGLNEILVFEQNGFTQNGAELNIRGKENIIGYLHPREEQWK